MPTYTCTDGLIGWIKGDGGRRQGRREGRWGGRARNIEIEGGRKEGGRKEVMDGGKAGEHERSRRFHRQVHQLHAFHGENPSPA
jgi:hypothetical protein